MKWSGRLSGPFLVAALAAAPAAAWATSLTVPDDVPTIQAALDAAPDTVFVLPGDYDESPVLSHPVTLMPPPEAVTLPRLAGLGLGQVELAMSIQGLDVFAAVVVGAGYPPLQEAGTRKARVSAKSVSQGSGGIDFLDCRLRGGVIDITDYVDLQTMTFRRCTIEGDIGAPPSNGGLGLRSYCLFESCTVKGGVDIEVQGPRVEVRGCTFVGRGGGFAIHVGGQGSTLVEGNMIRGYGVGIGASPEEGTVIRNNVIEDCVSSGIRAGYHGVSVTGNVIRRCGVGIDANGANALDVVDNVVEACTQMGILAGDYGSYHTRVSDNVVHDCGQRGLWISGDPATDLVVERNTLVRNGGSGLFWDLSGVLGTAIVRDNISYANGVNGVQWSTSNVSTVTCNDWFGNQAGDVAGMPPSATDFSVNPLFCDEAHDDFHLLDISPLANQPTCGQIGALGVACGATATQVARFTAERAPHGIMIVWKLGPGASPSEAWIERSEHGPDGPWVKLVTEVFAFEDGLAQLDRGVRSDQAYWYRLMATEAGSPVQLGSPIGVEALVLTFALGKVGPSPSSGPVEISFSLAQPATIDISVFDLLGRRVASLVRGEWQTGPHQVEWSGREAHAGVYLIRYRFPGGEAKRRLIRLP